MKKQPIVIGILISIIFHFGITNATSVYSYVIESYTIDIEVNENNTYDITETIKANFNVPKHGIYRTIPLKNTVTRLDGTTNTNKAQISNLEVSDEYSVTREDGKYKIKIGSDITTLTGEKTYKISYNYNIGKDKSKDYDEFYFNIIGTEWDTIIKNINFTITMPKDFEESKLGFSAGKKGATYSNKITYSVDGNVIRGSYDGTLYPKEGLTVRLELPEGYFVNAGYKMDSTTRLLLIVLTSCLLLSIYLWYKFGKDDEVIETVEFYPPENFNSLEIGFLYKGEATNEDVTSLLIYLANKGYIKIKETSSSEFQIIKLKDYDGTNDNEREFLNGLFLRSKSTVSIENIDMPVVTEKDLYNKFYKTTNKILRQTNSRVNKKKIFSAGTFLKSVPVALMIMISVIILMIYETEYIGFELAVFLCLMMVSIFWPGINSAFKSGDSKKSLVSHSKCYGFVMLCITAYIASKVGLGVALLILWSTICIYIMCICHSAMPKRNKYGNEILGKIKGFKNFLEVAEKEQLEAMVMKEPTYFYDILPYTYVLNVSDKWIEKFNAINIQAPEWYDSPSSFSMHHFGSFVKSTMNSAVAANTSSGSGGGYSGGGSSGGGSGGGGGGSW